MRGLAFLCFLLAGLSFILWLENRAVRADQELMKSAYTAFLGRKTGLSTLESKIKPESLAVFKTSKGIVGCAIMR